MGMYAYEHKKGYMAKCYLWVFISISILIYVHKLKKKGYAAKDY